MRCMDPGTLPKSEYFYHTPTVVAQPMLYFMVACGHFYCDQNYCIERDNFRNYLMIYVVSGALYLTCKDGKATAKPGQIALIDCHKHHKYQAADQTEFLFIHFEGANTATICEYIVKNMGIVIRVSKENKVQEYIQTMIAESRSNKVVTEIEHSKMIYTILCSLIQELHEHPELDDTGEVIRRAVTFIKEKISEPITVSDVAQHVNLSVFYFTRLFKKRTGFAPHEFITHSRIDHAKYLLRTTDQTVKEVAFSVGYRSEHSFSLAFSNKSGLSPGRFRNLRI